MIQPVVLIIISKCFSIILIHSLVSPDPEIACLIFINGKYTLRMKTFRAGIIGQGFYIISHNTIAKRAKPQIALRILEDASDILTDQRGIKVGRIANRFKVPDDSWTRLGRLWVFRCTYLPFTGDNDCREAKK